MKIYKVTVSSIGAFNYSSEVNWATSFNFSLGYYKNKEKAEKAKEDFEELDEKTKNDFVVSKYNGKIDPYRDITEVDVFITEIDVIE